jgi:Ser/Thr protein kinase RdoA (MazF antagonist)
MNATEHFFHLTPDIILESCDRAGFSPTGHLLQLNSLENRVFSLMLDDDSHIVMKFYRPGRWSREQILEEHSFVAGLEVDDVPVCSPLSLSGGSTVMETEGIYYAVWNRTGGRIPEEFSDEMLHSIGRTIARLHNVGAAGAFNHRVTMNIEQNIRQPFSFLKEKNFIPDRLMPRFETVVQSASAMFESAFKGVPFFRIHGDCHWGNLLCDRDKFFFLDFDDSCTGPAVQDIWMIAPGQDDHGRMQRSIMLEGYRQFRPFEEKWIKAVIPLKAARYIYYAAWIARRIDDPSFQRVFPQFGTDAYWEEELQDLEVLLREWDGDESRGLPSEEMLLSDSEYFFDMK